MPIEPETTTRRVHERTGDALRWMVRYRGDSLDPDRDLLFVRGDLEELLEDYNLEHSVRALVMAEPMAETQEEKLDMTAHRLTVRVYDDAVLLYVPYKEGTGLVVSVDATALAALPDLVEFFESLDRRATEEG